MIFLWFIIFIIVATIGMALDKVRNYEELISSIEDIDESSHEEDDSDYSIFDRWH